MSNGSYYPPEMPLDEPKQASLKETIALVKGFGREIVKKFWVLIIFAGLIGGLMFYMAWKEKVTYVATMTFMLSDGGSNYAQSIDPGILGMATSNPGLDKIAEMIKSRRIISKALFRRVEIDGKQDYLINHYLANFTTSKYRYSHDTINKLDIPQTRMLKNIHVNIIKTMLTHSISPSGIVTLSMTTTNEGFAYHFLKVLFQSASDYYLETSVEKQKKQYDLIRERFDSLSSTVNNSEKILADDYDSHLASLRFKEGVRQKGLQRNLNVQSRAFYEAADHLEAARIALETRTPIIQLIDEPMLPLVSQAPALRSSLIMGCFIGLVLGSFVVVIRKYLKDTLNKEPDPVSS